MHLALAQASLPGKVGKVKDRLRITIPIFHVVFDESTKGRIKVDDNVILAELNEVESRRIQRYHAKTMGYEDSFNVEARMRPPSHRIEIFAPPAPEKDPAELHFHRRAVSVLALLTVTSKAAPAWYSEPIDKWNVESNRWERQFVAYTSGGARCNMATGDANIDGFFPFTFGPAWFVQSASVMAWGRLLGLWKVIPENSPLDMALQYFYDAIILLQRQSWRSFISASICIECMLGDTSVELSYRISQRAANLARILGVDGRETYQHVRKAYNARSKLVHEGKHPDTGMIVEFLELLRKILPGLAVLSSMTGGHRNALAALDSLAVGDDSAIGDLKERSADWRVPDVTGGPVESPKERRKLAKDLFPDLNIDDMKRILDGPVTPNDQ